MTASFKLDRTVTIAATPDVVFRFFTDSARWATWWGAGSTVDPTPGGKVYMKHPGGVESGGEVVETKAPTRFVFTYGFHSGKPIPVGASRVTITLEAVKAGTRLRLDHELSDQAVRDEHVQGWRFQLSLFANVVANEVNAEAERRADRWFDAWAEYDAIAREAQFRAIASESLRFQDQYSNLDGLSDVLAHAAATQRFMPGIRMRRSGNVRHCQGMALCDWSMTGGDGKEMGRGTNAFVFDATGRIEWVTGFWSPPGQ